MPKLSARIVGFELYFDDLAPAQQFYQDVLGLHLTSRQSGHHAQFDAGSIFLCLETKGAEDYPSMDKAVIFLEVPNLHAAIETIGEHRILKREAGQLGRPAWAVLHDPEGHNILLLEAPHKTARQAPRDPLPGCRKITS